MSRLTAVVLSLLALSCSALKVPFAGRKVDARVTSPFVDFVAPTVRHNAAWCCESCGDG